MSYGANVSMAEIRADHEARHWFQIYLPKERDRCTELIKSVSEAGFEALEVVVDTPIRDVVARHAQRIRAAPAMDTSKLGQFWRVPLGV